MRYRIDKFTGIDQSKSDYLLSDGSARQAVNMDTALGALSVSGGFSRYTDWTLEGGIGTLAAFYRRESGVTHSRLVAVNALGIYALEDTGWSAISALPGNAQASTLNYQMDGEDILLLADGVRPVLKWNGEGQMSELSGCEMRFSQLALHYERIWGSGIAGEPDAVYWSRAFDPADWSGNEDMPEQGGGVVLIPTWNGGRVVALRALFNDVLVFKDDDLFRVVGTYPGNYEVVRVNGVTGPVAPQSIVSSADGCYFLSHDGLCAYNGVSVGNVLTDRAREVFGRVNPSAAAGAAAAIHKDRLYLALPLDGASFNNAVLEVDLTRGACLLRENLAAASFLPFDEQLLLAGQDGLIYRMDHSRTYAGAPIQAHWIGPWRDLKAPDTVKYFESINMHAGGTLRVRLETERGALERTMRLGTAVRPVSIRLGGHGRRFRLSFFNVDGSYFYVAPGVTLNLEDDSK